MKTCLLRTQTASHGWRSKRRGALIALASLLLAAPSFAEQERELATLSADVQRDALAVRPIGGPEAADMPELQVESAVAVVKLPSGERQPVYLISAYEPDSRLFWWTFQQAWPGGPADRLANLPRGLELFVSDREIIGVQMTELPAALWILRSSARARSHEAGREDVLAKLAGFVAAVERRGQSRLREVDLVSVLPSDFYFQPNHSMPPLELSVRSFERDGAGWLVTLEGREGRVAEVRLDALFNLRGARELKPEPERPDTP